MRFVLLTTTALLSILPTVAVAQSTQPSPSPSSSAADLPSHGLDDIIVTAQRQAQTLQSAAVAVDVIQGEELLNAGITEVDRLPELTPALAVAPTFSGPSFFLRGVGNFTVSTLSDPAVAFNYDGVYVGRPTSTAGVFYDIERLEILKGPQGTLYGRNATGGAINVLPAQPRLGETSGYVTASYGNYNALTAEGAFNAPLGENTAVRLSASISDRDGFLEDGTVDDETVALRLQIKSEITPALTVRAAADYSSIGGLGYAISYAGHYAYNPAAGGYSYVPSNVPISHGALTPEAQAYRETVTIGLINRKLTPLAPRPFVDNDYYGAHAEITYETDAGVLTVIPAWRSSKINYLGASGFNFGQDETDEQYSLEARFAGTRIGAFDYIVGAYYFDETIDATTNISFAASLTYMTQEIQTRSFAPFARLTAHVNDRLRLVGGLRYTKDKKDFAGQTTAGTLICVVPTGCPTAPLAPYTTDPSQLPFLFPAVPNSTTPIFVNGAPVPGAIIQRSDRVDDSSLSNSRVTYRAAVEFDLAPRSLLYASYETGYRSGGFASAEGFETYQPEYLDALTLGMKNRFLDNRLQLNLEAFHWKYKDQQINHIGPDLAGRSANYTENIGRSVIQGFDIESRFMLTPLTLVSANVQYLDAQNKEFVYKQAVGAPGSPPPLTGCAVAVNAANPALYDVDCSNFKAFNSPKWTLNLGAEQTFEVGGYDIVLGADTQYRSERDIGFQYLPEQRVGSTWLSNAHVTFSPTAANWVITAFVRNIENDRVPVQTSLAPFSNILLRATSQPRTYGARVAVKF